MKTPPPTDPVPETGRSFAPLSCRRYLFDRYWEEPIPSAGEAPPPGRPATNPAPPARGAEHRG